MDNPQYFNNRRCLSSVLCFKPYYKWITLNTNNQLLKQAKDKFEVLNLIING